jgi:hypothetical protein
MMCMVILDIKFMMYVRLYNDKGYLTTVRKRDFILRSMERIPKMQFSMARKFMLSRQIYSEEYYTKMLNFTPVYLPYTTAAVLLVAVHKVPQQLCSCYWGDLCR